MEEVTTVVLNAPFAWMIAVANAEPTVIETVWPLGIPLGLEIVPARMIDGVPKSIDWEGVRDRNVGCFLLIPGAMEGPGASAALGEFVVALSLVPDRSAGPPVVYEACTAFPPFRSGSSVLFVMVA